MNPFKLRGAFKSCTLKSLGDEQPIIALQNIEQIIMCSRREQIQKRLQKMGKLAILAYFVNKSLRNLVRKFSKIAKIRFL